MRMAGESRMNMAITGLMSGGGHVSLPVATVADLLGMHIQSGHLPDSAELSNLCLSLARGIDYAVANNEIPARAQALPLLLKQVLRRTNDSSLQAVSVLMVSVKNACKIGWFPDHDANDLLKLATEIGKNFSTMEDINVQPSYLLSVRKIMFRYYPRIRMGHVLASLDVKPGYRTCVVDFNITKSMLSPAQKHICLFVARTDDMETSSCIVFPPKVNFLLNGKGLRGRINGSTESGPQLPINVTAMVKYGKNLLQVVGRFNGNYIIIIAFMSMIAMSNTPELRAYIQPVAITVDSDLDVIEGEARVSLICPISFKRIKIPVKGHLCKHHQCFDYDNFMEINSRRPSWRCPHCNQFVCNPDIRIDQKMVKVLKEVEENVVDVIISPDGSWKPVTEHIDHGTRNNQPENSEQCESVGISNIPAHVVDLTIGEDDDNECPSSLGTEDAQSLSHNLRGFSAAEKKSPLGVNYMVEADQTASAQTEDHVRSAAQLPSSSVLHAHVLPTMSSNAERNFGDSRILMSLMSSHVFTDAICPFPWKNLGVHGEAQLPISSLQNRYSRAGNPEVQQARTGSSIASNQHGMVGIPNPGAAQVMGRLRNIVHPSIRVQPGPVQHRHGTYQVGGAAHQERNPISRMPSSVPAQLQPARTGTRSSNAMVAEQLRAAAREERQNMTGRTSLAGQQQGTPWSSLRADALAENWQPPRTMTGSLKGQTDSAAISQLLMPRPLASLTPTLQSGLAAFWSFPGSGNDGMYSQAETQGRQRSNWAGTGSSGSLPEWTPWMP